MNYIKQLQKENNDLQIQIIDMINKINEFRRHLNSSKFYIDPTIQVNDVQRYLNYITDQTNLLITN